MVVSVTEGLLKDRQGLVHRMTFEEGTFEEVTEVRFSEASSNACQQWAGDVCLIFGTLIFSFDAILFGVGPPRGGPYGGGDPHHDGPGGGGGPYGPGGGRGGGRRPPGPGGPPGGRRRDEGPPGVSLLIRNVGPETTSQDLQIAFGRIGEVRDVYIPRDFHSQQPKGFAFIEYATPEMAREAREEMVGFRVKGRDLEVVFAQERRKTPNEMRGRVVNQQNREGEEEPPRGRDRGRGGGRDRGREGGRGGGREGGRGGGREGGGRENRQR
jgi:hypothetical protein